MKCSGENLILRGNFPVVSGFPLHFMLYRGNLDCFYNSVCLESDKRKICDSKSVHKIDKWMCVAHWYSRPAMTPEKIDKSMSLKRLQIKK